MRSSARWPRAALQGAHDGKEMGELNITEITLAISCEKLVKTELENKDDYCKIESTARS